jgi:hypothetical protein
MVCRTEERESFRPVREKSAATPPGLPVRSADPGDVDAFGLVQVPEAEFARMPLIPGVTPGR